jgi:phosphatidate cytidylyltransferase
MKRVITGSSLVLIIIVVVKFLPPFCFLIFGLFCLYLAAVEFFRIVEKNGLPVLKKVGVTSTLIISFFFYTRYLPLDLLLVSIVIATSLISLLLNRDWGKTITSIGATVFGVIYLGFLLSYQFSLRLIEGGGEKAVNLLFYLFLVVASGDVGSYLLGTLFGQHKLFYSLSPGKTIEGLAGGLFFNIASSLLARFWFVPFIPLSHALVLPVVLGTFAQLSDLCESAFKRGAGIKDSSNILPGHGGVLDRIDSLIFTTPAFYYYYLFFLK